MSDEERLLTVRDIARRVGRSEETIRRWIWSGKLPAKKLGNQLFVEETDLARLQHARISDARAEYRTGGVARKRDVRGAIDLSPTEYDVEEKLRELEDAVKFGRMLKEKYGPVDVTELLRRVREEEE